MLMAENPSPGPMPLADDRAEKESLRTLSFAGVLSTNPRPCEQTYGAGKTTTMRIPPGLVMLDSGTMRSRPPRRISNRAQQDDWPERPFAPTITAAVRAFSLTPVSLSVTTGQGTDAPGSRTHVPGARPSRSPSSNRGGIQASRPGLPLTSAP